MFCYPELAHLDTDQLQFASTRGQFVPQVQRNPIGRIGKSNDELYLLDRGKPEEVGIHHAGIGKSLPWQGLRPGEASGSLPDGLWSRTEQQFVFHHLDKFQI